MRWNTEPSPRSGDCRTRTQFLFLPLRINHEVRWLERATWIESFWRGYDGEGGWEPRAWVYGGQEDGHGK